LTEKDGIQIFDVETRRETAIWNITKGDMMKIMRQVFEICVLRKGSYWNSLRIVKLWVWKFRGYAGE